jgi:hypothetical protein
VELLAARADVLAMPQSDWTSKFRKVIECRITCITILTNTQETESIEDVLSGAVVAQPLTLAKFLEGCKEPPIEDTAKLICLGDLRLMGIEFLSATDWDSLKHIRLKLEGPPVYIVLKTFRDTSATL